MAAAFAPGSQECVDAALRRGESLQVAAEGEGIGMVVAAAVFGNMLAPGHHAAYARQLVGGDADTDSAAADQHGQCVRWIAGQGCAGQPGEVGVVNAVGAGTAVIGAVVPEFGQVVDELLFELEAAVVATEVDFHAALPMMAAANRLAVNITISTLISRR